MQVLLLYRLAGDTRMHRRNLTVLQDELSAFQLFLLAYF